MRYNLREIGNTVPSADRIDGLIARRTSSSCHFAHGVESSSQLCGGIEEWHLALRMLKRHRNIGYSKNPDGAGLTRRVCDTCSAGSDDSRSRASSTTPSGYIERLLRSGGSVQNWPEAFGRRKEVYIFGSRFGCTGRVSAERELERPRVYSVYFRIGLVLESDSHSLASSLSRCADQLRGLRWRREMRESWTRPKAYCF